MPCNENRNEYTSGENVCCKWKILNWPRRSVISHVHKLSFRIRFVSFRMSRAGMMYDCLNYRRLAVTKTDLLSYLPERPFSISVSTNSWSDFDYNTHSYGWLTYLNTAINMCQTTFVEWLNCLCFFQCGTTNAITIIQAYDFWLIVFQYIQYYKFDFNHILSKVQTNFIKDMQSFNPFFNFKV